MDDFKRLAIKAKKKKSKKVYQQILRKTDIGVYNYMENIIWDDGKDN